MNAHDANKEFDEIFSEMDDFSISSCIAGAVEERHGYENIAMWSASVPIEHRTVGYLWAMIGGIENSGLPKFFASHCNHSALLESLSIIGLDDLSQELKEDFRIVPQECYGDTEDLISHFGTLSKMEKLLRGPEEKIFDSVDLISNSVYRYIQKNKSEFEDLVPEIRIIKNSFKKLNPPRN